MKFLRDLIALVNIEALPSEWRQLVLYSEGRSHWVYFSGIVEQLLSIQNGPNVTYVSSDKCDPALKLKHDNFRSIVLETDYARDWFHANIRAKVFGTTTPDLGIYQVKRSKHKVHYVYIPHSLVSLHMAYRPGAFDHFDTLFCAGPHHIREARALEDLRGTKKKKLVKHGYDRLDKIRANISASAPQSDLVIVAPSWGDGGIIETIGEELAKILLDSGFKVVFRPHPQTVRLHAQKLAKIEAIFGQHSRFKLEKQISTWETMAEAGTMISDWSGVALEFAAARRRPIIFLDTPRKVNNHDYQRLAHDPIEITMRKKIGVVVDLRELEKLPKIVRDQLRAPDLPVNVVDEIIFNKGKAAIQGAQFFAHLLERDQR